MKKITERIDHTNEMVGDWCSELPPCPKAVKISLDDHCQFKCTFCASGMNEVKARMSMGKFKRLVDELVANGTEEIGLFFIGEPMLVKGLDEAVRYCKGVGVKYVFLTTNGALATKEKVRGLMEAGLDSIKFSYNYADGSQIKAVAGVPERTFDKLVENIRGTVEVRDAGGYKCGVYASSIMFDGEQGEKMLAAVGLIAGVVDEHYWLPQYTFGAQADGAGEFKVRGNPGRLDNLRDPMPCWTIFKEGHVTADGAVALCCFDVQDKWMAGKLREDGSGFMEAWHSDAARALRLAHLEKDVHGTACEACVYGTGGEGWKPVAFVKQAGG